MCDSQALLRDPRRTVAGFFSHFDIRLTDESGGRATHGEAFGMNSKDWSPYSGGVRVRNLARSRA